MKKYDVFDIVTIVGVFIMLFLLLIVKTDDPISAYFALSLGITIILLLSVSASLFVAGYPSKVVMFIIRTIVSLVCFYVGTYWMIIGSDTVFVLFSFFFGCGNFMSQVFLLSYEGK